MTPSFSHLLLISDIDGTFITDEGFLPERNLEAIARFTQAGGRFSFATGRSVAGTARFARRAGVNAPCIVCNGGGIYDFNREKMLWSRNLPEGYGEVVRRVRERFPDVGIEIYSGSAVYYASENAYTEDHASRQGFTGQPCPGAFPQEANKVLFAASHERLHEVAAFIEELDSGGWEGVFSSPIYYELLPQGISKGAAVARLADILGIDPDNVACIGDYYNDLEMLQSVKLSAAPAEAPEEIRRAAKITLGPCEEGAVADLIEYLARKQSLKTE